MRRFNTRLSLVIGTVLLFSASAFAGPLDDYYLQQFGVQSHTQPDSALQKAILLPASDSNEMPQCGTPLKHKLRLDWDKLEPTTQKVLAKTVALLPGWVGVQTSESKFNLPGGRFLIHYTTTGADAPPLTDSDTNGVPDWVEIVAQTFENVATTYSGLNWHLAPTVNNTRYDIYLRNLVGITIDGKTVTLYGQTTTSQFQPSSGFTNAAASYIEIDKDFTNTSFVNAPNGPYDPLNSLRITAAHEYHHAIQYGYNFYFDIWYAEATSTWMEDEPELYDGVNQLYNYVPAWFNNSTKSLDLAVGSDAVTVGAGYGRWIFNRYLAEKHTPAMIRSVWENLALLSSPGGGANIPMIPVLEGVLSTSYGTSLGNDFFGFTKRVYTRDWTNHDYDTSRIHPYTPIATYSTYPVNNTVTLPHYSFAYYDFTTSIVTSLTVSINKTSGIQTALFKNGSEIAVTSGAYVIGTFRPTDKVVLLIVNSTSTDGHNASFSTNGNPSSVTEPTIPTPITPTPTTSTSGGGGCFIATAAYGSYLHPHVQMLRNFRDEHLLTNAPGRAFVALYYRYSPPLADFIARHAVLRGITRLALTPFIVAVVYPLIPAISLSLFIGGAVAFRWRRKKIARSNAHSYIIHATSSRF